MSYMAAQALLKTLIQTCTSFETGAVVEGDVHILDITDPAYSGFTKACVLYPGPLPEYDLSRMAREHTYVALADLGVRLVTTPADMYNGLGTLRDAVMDTIKAGRCLSATYFVISVSGDDPQELDNGRCVAETLRITIQENL